MGYWLAQPGEAQQNAPLTRFDARFWTINFPRPMMAAVTTPAPDALRVDAIFYRRNDLAGLIWASVDREDHPLLAYETAPDYRGLTLRFRWRAGKIRALDAVHGPTLTIEGRDARGQPRHWYVRLWNYARGTPNDAQITLDFDRLAGGFLLPSEADPVWAGDIDRMFIALVPPGYDGQDLPLAEPVEGWAELSDLRCTGPSSTLQMGDVLVPPHGLSIATGYDDAYHLTPERVVRQAWMLGYRGAINHYVGMSHYPRLAAIAGGWQATLAGGAINAATAARHRDFAQRAAAAGFGVILSLSFELFAAYCPEAWQQRAANGDPARTGWSPPSALLSPAHGGAMAYLAAVAIALMDIIVAAGHRPRFQIGEPWWWVMPDGRICLYDAAARTALGGNPVALPDVRRADLSPAQKALLDAAGGVLARATAGLAAAVRARWPEMESLLLLYLPSVMDPAAPEIRRANAPLGWRAPAFDILQIEAYDWVTEGQEAASQAAIAATQARLGYGPSRQHYLAGFVARADQAAQWQPIQEAADRAADRGVAARFIWALPQVARDGFTVFSIGEDQVQEFDDVDFPMSLGRAAEVQPSFSTAIVTTASGHEQRNMNWANARLRYDVGPGVRSEADVQALLSFFRARRGAARSFRFRDPLDQSSNAMTGIPTALDVRLGTGDGTTRSFALVKFYGGATGGEARRITRPVPDSVRVALDAAPRPSGWTLEEGGMIVFSTPPGPGVAVTAGFLFDVPVRFDTDQLSIAGHGPAAGEVVSVPLIEVRD